MTRGGKLTAEAVEIGENTLIGKDWGRVHAYVNGRSGRFFVFYNPDRRSEWFCSCASGSPRCAHIRVTKEAVDWKDEAQS